MGALSEGAVAIALLRAGGSSALTAVRALSIVAGLPFTVVMMYMCTALWRALAEDQGDTPPAEQRGEWSMPLYAGIFDLPEVALTLGRAPMPPARQLILFVQSLLCP